jgi:hydroxymethylglutaryl-CoA lyase
MEQVVVDDVKIIECPRDAIQGIETFIDTDKKIRYLNRLLKVGFDTLDFGSFVSPKAVPQMADTESVLEGLDWEDSDTKLLAIVANIRGAKMAASHRGIVYMGYPFSISETFQLRNTHESMEAALETVKAIQEICNRHDKTLVLYMSMAFGNPYGDPYDREIVNHWVNVFDQIGIRTISLSDTVGMANAADVSYLYRHLIPAFPQIEFGGHFHSTPSSWEEKLAAAYDNGCGRFDGALGGYGGCPMALDDLVGNIATENLLRFLMKRGVPLHIDENALSEAQALLAEVFS